MITVLFISILLAVSFYSASSVPGLTLMSCRVKLGCFKARAVCLKASRMGSMCLTHLKIGLSLVKPIRYSYPPGRVLKVVRLLDENAVALLVLGQLTPARMISFINFIRDFSRLVKDSARPDGDGQGVEVESGVVLEEAHQQLAHSRCVRRSFWKNQQLFKKFYESPPPVKFTDFLSSPHLLALN